MNVIATNETGLPDPHCRIGRVTPKKYSRNRTRGSFAAKTLQLRRELMFGVFGPNPDRASGRGRAQ